MSDTRMRHDVHNIGHGIEIGHQNAKAKVSNFDSFVLEKGIFNNIFEKDIKRVFIYKKAERLAKATHLIAPAFADSVPLRNRVDAIAVGLVDAAILPPLAARRALARELLALSSILSLASTSELLSPMNADLIAREAHMLLQEIAGYEEPRLALEEVPTLSSIAKNVSMRGAPRSAVPRRDTAHPPLQQVAVEAKIKNTGSVKDTKIKDRRDSILSVIKNKGRANIKDISTMIRGVSEKTIQRELMVLVAEGAVLRQGERRWSTYSLA